MLERSKSAEIKISSAEDGKTFFSSSHEMFVVSIFFCILYHDKQVSILFLELLLVSAADSNP